jgi:hypothetical protein
MKEKLAFLSAYLKNQLLVTNELIKKIEKEKIGNEKQAVYVGYLCHNFYCALEDLFREVAKVFENEIEEEDRYHRELLKKMNFEVPGFRPALLSKRSFLLLDEVRGFRHLFRHAYEYEISTVKVKDLSRRILKTWPHLRKDLENFNSFLKEQLEEKGKK